MRRGSLDLPPMGGEGKTVEVDETYIGKTDQPKAPATPRRTPYTKSGKSGPANKRAIVSLVERGGEVRSFHVPHATKENVMAIVHANIHHETTLYTDESNLYRTAHAHFVEHSTVKHSAKEYARGPVHTNTVEGFFSDLQAGHEAASISIAPKRTCTVMWPSSISGIRPATCQTLNAPCSRSAGAKASV